jgi:hypothetical protein
MVIGEADDLLDKKLFGLRCRYVGWMERQGAEVQITEEVIEAAAGNETRETQ